MKPASLSPRERHDALSLIDLYDLLWRQKIWIAGWAVAAAVLALVVALFIPKTYEASVLVYPVSKDPSGGAQEGLGSLVSRFGGLASLAGISVGASERKAETLAVLRSRELTQRYIQEKNLLPVLFAKKWAADRSAWRESDPEEIPSLWDGNEYFRDKVRRVSEDAKTGLVTLTIRWRDPVIASQWANDLVARTNEHVRGADLADSEANIQYLTAEVAKTNMVKVQEAIYSIMETEIKRAMMARGNRDYVLKVIDRAVPPEEPSSPKPLVWALAAFFIALFISAGVVLLRGASWISAAPTPELAS